MTGLQLYLLIAPLAFLALAWVYVLWIRHSADKMDRAPRKQHKAS